MTFNIGNQSGGVINNVAGDQWIDGGQQGTVVTVDTARQAARLLRQAVDAAPLPADVADTARRHADDIDSELRRDNPDRPTVADRLHQLTTLLTWAGSLVAAATSIVGPVRTIATWLGQFGAPIAHLLP